MPFFSSDADNDLDDDSSSHVTPQQTISTFDMMSLPAQEAQDFFYIQLNEEITKLRSRVDQQLQDIMVESNHDMTHLKQQFQQMKCEQTSVSTGINSDVRSAGQRQNRQETQSRSISNIGIDPEGRNRDTSPSYSMGAKSILTDVAIGGGVAAGIHQQHQRGRYLLNKYQSVPGPDQTGCNSDAGGGHRQSNKSATTTINRTTNRRNRPRSRKNSREKSRSSIRSLHVSMTTVTEPAANLSRNQRVIPDLTYQSSTASMSTASSVTDWRATVTSQEKYEIISCVEEEDADDDGEEDEREESASSGDHTSDNDDDDDDDHHDEEDDDDCQESTDRTSVTSIVRPNTTDDERDAAAAGTNSPGSPFEATIRLITRTFFPYSPTEETNSKTKKLSEMPNTDATGTTLSKPASGQSFDGQSASSASILYKEPVRDHLSTSAEKSVNNGHSSPILGSNVRSVPHDSQSTQSLSIHDAPIISRIDDTEYRRSQRNPSPWKMTTKPPYNTYNTGRSPDVAWWKLKNQTQKLPSSYNTPDERSTEEEEDFPRLQRLRRATKVEERNKTGAQDTSQELCLQLSELSHPSSSVEKSRDDIRSKHTIIIPETQLELHQPAPTTDIVDLTGHMSDSVVGESNRQQLVPYVYTEGSRDNHLTHWNESIKLDQVKAKTIKDPYGDKGLFTGMLIHEKPHGHGSMQYIDGRSYVGEWRYGRWHGYGRALFANGDFYVGEYRSDQRHGSGRYEWHDGRIYEGQFRRDLRDGTGSYSWPDGSSYSGEFCQGHRHGQGCYAFVDGSLYTGEWQSGKYHGVGQCMWSDGRSYRGEWKEGRAHGYGIEFRKDGSIRHDGKWSQDRPVRRKKTPERDAQDLFS